MTHVTVEPAALDVSRRLMAFNWMPAGYAHRDWLGPWADILEPRSSAGPRVVRRASIVLLNRYQLRERYIRDLGTDGWLLQSYNALTRLAGEIGTAMLGGWVLRRLERKEVALQLKVLGAEGRAAALERAHTMRALPFAPVKAGWPVAPTGPTAKLRLGLSCMATLLDDEASGARERLTLRFPFGLIVPIVLTQPQRDEAVALIHGASDSALGLT
jgi:YOP proteins translocation protein K (YscK)